LLLVNQKKKRKEKKEKKTEKKELFLFCIDKPKIVLETSFHILISHSQKKNKKRILQRP